MNNKILIVDDMEINRSILEGILEDQYEVIHARNGIEAISKIDGNMDELLLILLDIIMPLSDGFEVLEQMQRRGWTETIPVIVISTDTDVNSERRAFKMGVADFIHKPFDPILVQHRVANVADLYIYRKAIENQIGRQNTMLSHQFQLVKSQADELKKKNRQLEEEHEKLHQSKLRVIDILGTVVETRNLESGEHINRVKGYTKILARRVYEKFPEYGLTIEDIDKIAVASALHDIGKIAIPDSILLKPGKLTSEEFDIMKTHTTKGSEMISGIENAWDDEYGRLSYDICRYHHERYDGRGYPEGLVGEDIPISAQLVSIADVYDALIHKRVYKDAFALEEAFNMIMDGKCGTFSPKLLECFSDCRAQMEAM